MQARYKTKANPIKSLDSGEADQPIRCASNSPNSLPSARQCSLLPSNTQWVYGLACIPCPSSPCLPQPAWPVGVRTTLAC